MQLLQNDSHPDEREGGGDNRTNTSSTAQTATTTQEVLTHLFEDRELLRCDDDSMSIDQCETIREMEDRSFETSTPASIPVTTVAAMEAKAIVVPPASVGVLDKGSSIDGGGSRFAGAEGRSEPVKKKRGRPPKLGTATGVQQKKKAAAVVAPPEAAEEEEDVCFICFDGGDLVLCDRRGCPKAYHPSCIKRDESFFKSRAKWNCGWHICSTCQKAAYYMCYTCTYSVCKSCTRTADYVCIRGTKGLCGTCMKTIMLIEKVPQANNETVQVDFDDKTSWEYLFKVYWTLLKEKLALTLDELIQAKTPWQDPGIGFHRGISSGEVYNGNVDNGFGLDSFGRHVAADNIRGSKAKKRQEIINKDAKHPEIISKNAKQPEIINKDAHVEHANLAGIDTSCGQNTEWASKELQEFVAHMRNGDKNVLSQSDVQALLLEYIKRNNLRDPSRKCQIICDPRLSSLLGKAIVGHFEMLKLLESHFPTKENSQLDGLIRGAITEAVPNQTCINIEGGNGMALSNDKRRRPRKRGNDKVPQLNPDEFAAIDAHNIGLIYLQRDMMEKMIDDPQRFHEKVVGSIVRIRVGGDDLKQDMYRLVQVTGTIKVTELYKVGDRSTDFKLEVLNLGKKEVIPIDEISNQDFSEDECRRLQQSFKCELGKQLTVGEIQQKALVLQEGKVNNWLDTEILRLNHLRDRASEKGQRKELREYVEKLQLLNSPEERQRRLRELPEVHPDHSINTSYKPEDAPVAMNQKKQEWSLAVNHSKRKMRASISSETRSDDMNAMGKRPRKRRVIAAEKPVVLGLRCVGTIGSGQLHENNQSSGNQKKEAHGISSKQNGVNASDVIGSASAIQRNQTSVKHESQAAPEVSPSPLSTGAEQSVNDIEIYKIWHYQDPTGKVQGPFTMAQLRKWSTSGHFPPDLRIWRIDEKQEDSTLLTDALNGLFNKELPFLPQEMRDASDDRDTKEVSTQNNVEETSKDLISAEESCNPKESDSLPNEAATEAVATGALSSDSSHQTAQASEVAATGALSSNSPPQTDQAITEVSATVVLSSNSSHQTRPDNVTSLDEVKAVNVSQCPNSSDATDPLVEPKACSNSIQIAVGETKQDEISPQSNEDNELYQNNGRQNPELSNKNHDICQDSGHENVDQCPIDQTKNEQHSEKQVDGEGGLTQSSDQNWKTQVPPVSSSNGWDSRPTVSLDDPVAASRPCKEIDLLGLFSPTKPSNEVKNSAGDDKCTSTKIPFQDMGPSWSTSSSLLAGAPHVNDVPGQWSGYSAAPTKPVDEWDSSLMSASSPKPTEMMNEHAATPSSEAGQLPQSSQTHPVLDLSWQAIVNENDFSSLAEESVSDLLAEVEAMESMNGLPSPTSALKRAEDLAEGSKDDCFSPVEGFCPAPDPRKSDALSSTIDFLTLSQSAITDASQGRSKDLADASRISHGHSSSNVEMEIDGKHSDASVNQWKPGTNSEVQHPTPSTASWDPATAPTWREGSMADNTWGTVQSGANLGWYNNANTDWESRQRSGHGNGNLGRPTSAGNSGFWGNQPRYGSRYSSPRDHSNPRDRAYQGTDIGNPRGRSGWNRQFSGGGAGSNSRQGPKGQRVCKYYEYGNCKKGASCSYLHP